MSEKAYTVTADQALMVPNAGKSGRRHVNAGQPFAVTEEFGQSLMAQGVKLEKADADLGAPPPPETVDAPPMEAEAPPREPAPSAEAGGAGGQKAAPVEEKPAKPEKKKPGPKPKGKAKG